MPDFTITDGQHGVYNKTTAAATEIVIDITRPISKITIRKYGSAAPALYYTTNGEPATVEGQNTHEIPANLAIQDEIDVETVKGQTKTLRLISAGIVNFSVVVE